MKERFQSLVGEVLENEGHVKESDQDNNRIQDLAQNRTMDRTKLCTLGPETYPWFQQVLSTSELSLLMTIGYPICQSSAFRLA